jgi:hypothetical protein
MPSVKPAKPREMLYSRHINQVIKDEALKCTTSFEEETWKRKLFFFIETEQL